MMLEGSSRLVPGWKRKVLRYNGTRRPLRDHEQQRPRGHRLPRLQGLRGRGAGAAPEGGLWGVRGWAPAWGLCR